MEIILGFIIGSLISGGLSFFIYKNLSEKQNSKLDEIATSILNRNEQNLSTLVSPFNDKVKEYREYFESIHKFDLKDRESLRERLGQMLDSAGKIQTETNLLTRALSSDVKFQGSWGELTLERILELSGLTSNQEFFTQMSLTDLDGKVFKPDVVIKLPNSASIIIDSKVSLTSYFDYYNQGESLEALKKLKQSISSHIDSLSKKKYQNLEGINSVDFVYLFVPVEGVYSLVLREFPEIIDESLKKNIVLVSPVNLIASLKTVASLWRLENQTQNATDIAQKAGAMYDKLVLFVEDLEKVGSSIDKAQQIYLDSMKKLNTGSGNLVKRAEELKTLGAKTTKSLS